MCYLEPWFIDLESVLGTVNFFQAIFLIIDTLCSMKTDSWKEEPHHWMENNRLHFIVSRVQHCLHYHYENTPIQIYRKFHLKKKTKKKKKKKKKKQTTEYFQIKNSIFYISLKNIDCGYSLELPQRGGSNEYPQSMFWA